MSFSLKDIFSHEKTAPAKAGGNSVLGIDIGSTSIKVIEIKRTEQSLTLNTYGELQLGPYGGKELGEKVKLPLKELTKALVDIIRESNASSQAAMLAMPLSSSFITVVPIVANEESELEGKVPVEARKFIPIPLHDVMLDWTLLSAKEGEGGSQKKIFEVLLAAVQNDAFNNYRALLTATELDSGIPEIEIFSTVRGVSPAKDERIAIIDLGADTNKLYITQNNMLERIHRVPEGGVDCTRKIAEMRSCTFEEAENIKRAAEKGTEEFQHVEKAFTSTIERTLHEFKRVIDQYDARVEKKVSRIVLCGGGGTFPLSKTLVKDALNRDVEPAHPFSHVAYPAFMEDILTDIGPAFTTSLGAALRHFE